MEPSGHIARTRTTLEQKVIAGFLSKGPWFGILLDGKNPDPIGVLSRLTDSAILASMQIQIILSIAGLDILNL